MKERLKVAFLGPEGTYSHLVADKRFSHAELIKFGAIFDIFYFLTESPYNKGVIPVENSSGGPIAESLDLLVNNDFNITIEESLRLNVKLALLGRVNEDIKTIYSHPIPMYHCDLWIRKNYPDAAKISVSSTAKAAELAAKEKNSAAIASITSASIYKLDIIHYPIEQNIPNTTQFFVISKSPLSLPPKGKNIKTSISAFFPSRPGSLYDFLEPFKTNNVNLSRIISRPIHGTPNEYAFFVDLDGGINDIGIKNALDSIKNREYTFKLICSYNDDLTYSL